jgi:hypothetical protein
MVNQTPRQEWGLYERSAGTTRRWGPRKRGDRKSGAERMARCRKKKTAHERRIETALLTARKAIKAGRRPERGRGKPGLRPGQQVRYHPLGSRLIMQGTVVRIWRSPAHCPSRYAGTLVVVERTGNYRKRNKRLRKLVALPPANVF